MQFLLDSCISGFAVRELRAAGYGVVWTAEGPEDPGDDVILEQAAKERRILVTADKDFGDLVFVFRKPHPTIVRLVEIPARMQGKILLRLIETHQDELAKGALLTVERFRTRVRLPEEGVWNESS
jgi:predicted nuclease of predicted toxin-antitoxin system